MVWALPRSLAATYGITCCFLFLRLLRCFSSAGSRLHTMDSCTVAAGVLQQVSPFRDPRIEGYLHLPAAFRSLSRLSSALSAKASTLRSFCLTASRPASVRDMRSFGHGLRLEGHVQKRSRDKSRLHLCFMWYGLFSPYHLGCLDILLEYLMFCMRFSRYDPD